VDVNSTMYNSRSEIIKNADSLQYFDDFLDSRQYLLSHYVSEFDSEIVELLLKLGSDPNINPFSIINGNNLGFLFGLIDSYRVQYTLKGDVILEVAKVLLENGADPNIIDSSYSTPIEECGSKNMDSFKRLLQLYGGVPSKEMGSDLGK